MTEQVSRGDGHEKVGPDNNHLRSDGLAEVKRAECSAASYAISSFTFYDMTIRSEKAHYCSGVERTRYPLFSEEATVAAVRVTRMRSSAGRNASRSRRDKERNGVSVRSVYDAL